MRLLDIEPGKKPFHLFSGDRSCLRFRCRPQKPVFFQALVPQGVAVPVIVENLQGVLLPTAEDEVVTTHRVHLQRVGYQAGQTVDSIRRGLRSKHAATSACPFVPAPTRPERSSQAETSVGPHAWVIRRKLATVMRPRTVIWASLPLIISAADSITSCWRSISLLNWFVTSTQVRVSELSRVIPSGRSRLHHDRNDAYPMSCSSQNTFRLSPSVSQRSTWSVQ